MNYLKKYLQKLGITATDLDENELSSYNEWKESLSGRKLTDEDVSDFIEGMRVTCINKLRKVTDLSEKELIFYSMQLDLVENIQTFLRMPEIEKKLVQNHVESLIETS